MLKTYLLIGLITQIVIIIERRMLNKWSLELCKTDSLKELICLIVSFLVLCAINIALWPITIIIEIISIIKGI